MIAETAYNVIDALSETEKKRLYKMLKVSMLDVREKKKKKPIITDAEATEYLLKKLTIIKENKYKKIKQQ